MPDFIELLRRFPLRFHGNGFIQVFLNTAGTHRIHIWHPDLPPLSDHNATIHDHLFDMDSEVLVGEITHETYAASEPAFAELGPTHDVYEVNTETGELSLYGHGSYVRTGINIMAAGSRYIFPAGQFHDTPHNGELAVTRFVKTPNITGRGPKVVCLRGETPTDAFDSSRTPDRKLLMQLAANVLYGLGARKVQGYYEAAAKEKKKAEAMR